MTSVNFNFISGGLGFGGFNPFCSGIGMGSSSMFMGGCDPMLMSGMMMGGFPSMASSGNQNNGKLAQIGQVLNGMTMNFLAIDMFTNPRRFGGFWW